MLQTLRKGAASWVAKIFLGLLVISFAVWGIADIFRNFGTEYVAKVGDTEISVEAFRNAYTEQMRNFGQQRGRALTAEEARAIGLGQYVLGNLVSEAVLNERARALGLAISDDQAAADIRQDRTFQGPNGSFDRTRFNLFLRQIGLTEAQFLANERARAARAQLINAVAGDVTVPVALREALHHYINDTRSIVYLTLTPAILGELPTPDEATLRSFYEERKSAFRAPEYRRVTILSLEPKDVAATIAVSDEEARRAFEADKARYTVPERRRLEQIVFPNRQEAEAAAQKLAAGTSFADLAKELGRSQADIDLGTVTRSELLDPAVAEAAFALPAGATSQPVEGAFGTVLVHVAGIEPGREEPFDAVRDRVVEELKLRQGRDTILDIHDRIEDARAAGETLAEIGPRFGAAVRTVEAVDRTGKDPSGADVDLPEKARLLPEVFRSSIGVETDAIPLQNQGFVWYELRDVTPDRDRTFEEARAEVESRWREDRGRELLNARAREFVDKLKAGETLAQLAAANGLQVESAAGVTRTGGTSGLGTAAANAIFALPVGDFGTSAGPDPANRIVFQVSGEASTPFDPATAELGTSQLRQALSSDLNAQYLAELQRELGVTYNFAAVQSVVGTPES